MPISRAGGFSPLSWVCPGAHLLLREAPLDLQPSPVLPRGRKGPSLECIPQRLELPDGCVSSAAPSAFPGSAICQAAAAGANKACLFLPWCWLFAVSRGWRQTAAGLSAPVSSSGTGACAGPLPLSPHPSPSPPGRAGLPWTALGLPRGSLGLASAALASPGEATGMEG
uniref:Uncharacterized protein n=1 Tax=Myotis myotis TaxID=51298 RepID=A0A7J7WW28_MYOMY|nr:hypothetical protein mMyoMyo1_011867 [Myotis myotis]